MRASFPRPRDYDKLLSGPNCYLYATSLVRVLSFSITALRLSLKRCELQREWPLTGVHPPRVLPHAAPVREVLAAGVAGEGLLPCVHALMYLEVALLRELPLAQLAWERLRLLSHVQPRVPSPPALPPEPPLAQLAQERRFAHWMILPHVHVERARAHALVTEATGIFKRLRAAGRLPERNEHN